MPSSLARIRRIVSPEMAEQPDLDATIARFIDRKIRLSPKLEAAPIIVGLCGAQGIGKSTVSRRVAIKLRALRHSTLVIGLDDLYLPRSERLRLAKTIHPLLKTRGVPGTHDTKLGLALLNAAKQPGLLSLPRFDKAIDDRIPRAQWLTADSRPAVILLEGWCVGAVAQSEADLIEPVNELERLEDADCTWRQFVNDALRGTYRGLFAKLDALILLSAPSFDIVTTWRRQQESQLHDELRSSKNCRKTMNKTEIDRFVLHYERLTRHILLEMPERADLVLHLDTERKVVGIAGRSISTLRTLN
jgi:D-glycerate 3-kinase